MQLIKYIFAGVFNTAVGYGVFWVLLSQFGTPAEYANAVGYGVALIFAFLLNKIFVFNNSTFQQRMIPKFILAFLASFIINQIVLILLHRVIGIRAEIAQFLAMGTYTVIFYLLNKRFVFSENLAQSKH